MKKKNFSKPKKKDYHSIKLLWTGIFDNREFFLFLWTRIFVYMNFFFWMDIESERGIEWNNEGIYRCDK